MYTTILIASALLGIIEIFLDRFSGALSNPGKMVVISTFTQFAFIAPLLGFFQGISNGAWLVVLSVGIYSTLSRVVWWKLMASRANDVSSIAPMIRLFIPLTAILSYVFFQEAISVTRAIAMLLITVGSIGLGVFGGFKQLKLDKFLLAAVAITASSIALLNVSYKYLSIEGYSIVTIFLAVKMTQLGALTFFHNNLDIADATFIKPNLFILARVAQTLGALLYIFALSGLDLAFAVPLAASIPPIYWFIDAAIKHRKDPERRIEFHKIGLIILIGIGVYFNA